MGFAIPAFQSGKKIIVQVKLSCIVYLYLDPTETNVNSNEVFLKKATWDDNCSGASHFCCRNLMRAQSLKTLVGSV